MGPSFTIKPAFILLLTGSVLGFGVLLFTLLFNYLSNLQYGSIQYDLWAATSLLPFGLPVLKAIGKYAKKPLEDVIDDLSMLIGNLKLYNESLIEPHHWQEAERLTTNVDHFDISYVALTLQTGGWLWTGDKKLTTHLQALGFKRVLNTEELYQMLNQPEKED
ncbi:MAG: hypothetical protein EOO39_18330 [Cytophagaceae bacterium]|nr:MAG: hypothetical protein EOO39_18330 [Cytophagaceae bacterium]